MDVTDVEEEAECGGLAEDLEGVEGKMFFVFGVRVVVRAWGRCGMEERGL